MIKEDEPSKEGEDHKKPRKAKKRTRSLCEYQWSNSVYLVFMDSQMDNSSPFFPLDYSQVWAHLKNRSPRMMLEIGNLLPK